MLYFKSENGCIGAGPAPEAGKEDKHLTNAGAGFITLLPGAACFDSATFYNYKRRAC